MQTEDLKIIAEIANFMSITEAAKHLEKTTATASAALKRVEETLGVSLFIRTTRRMKLSAAGEKYLPYCRQVLNTLNEAQMSLAEERGAIEGPIRLSVSSDLGRNIVVPWIDELMEEHEKLSIYLSVSDLNLDFYRDPIDAALRYGSPTESNIYGYKIADVPRVLCASPEYLERNGTPTNIADLSHHSGLFYELHGVAYRQWEFLHHGSRKKIKMNGVRSSNDADIVRRWCVAGKGIALKSMLDMAQDLIHHRVVTILPDLKPTSTELWLICPERQKITPAFRLLRDKLTHKCSVLMESVTHGRW
ncbi:MAG: LysR family transcriptional regulator [Pseudobacteriovorax sp.]|nr:LysR family transcriptional regulator [Pseudobacteriovorax sp.]